MKLKIYTSKGEVSGDIAVKDEVFKVDMKETLVSQAVKAHLANKRVAIAHTKDRGEVSGGGKKPWKQKGTGRARAGSSRSPIWRGGGVTFGPRKNQNFSEKLTASMKKSVRRVALSQKAKDSNIYTVKGLESIARGDFVTLADKLKLGDKKILLINNSNSDKIYKATRNMANVSNIGANSINAYDIFNNDVIVWSPELVKKVQPLL